MLRSTAAVYCSRFARPTNGEAGAPLAPAGPLELLRHVDEEGAAEVVVAAVERGVADPVEEAVRDLRRLGVGDVVDAGGELPGVLGVLDRSRVQPIVGRAV